jgi:hypothetical protein
VKPKNSSLRVSFPFDDSTIDIADIDGSMTLGALLSQHGLLPRDGSFQFLSDSRGRMINYIELKHAPQVVHVKYPKNIDQLWVDEGPKQGFANALSSNGEQIALLGGEENMFTSVFITSWKNWQKHRVAYRFSPSSPYYNVGDLVYIRVPLKGHTVTLYNPESGIEDIRINLDDRNQGLESMRGFWSAWELNHDTKSATYRQDITPIPKGFKPLKARPKRGRRLYSPVSNLQNPIDGHQIRKGKVKFGNRFTRALVCGVSEVSSKSNRGFIVAKSNKTRPNFVNLDGYQYGMTQFVKIPDNDRVVELYNPKTKQFVECTLINNDHHPLDTIRGQWAIVILKKHSKYKRALQIVGVPREYYGERSN